MQHQPAAWVWPPHQLGRAGGGMFGDSWGCLEVYSWGNLKRCQLCFTRSCACHLCRCVADLLAEVKHWHILYIRKECGSGSCPPTAGLGLVLTSHLCTSLQYQHHCFLQPEQSKALAHPIGSSHSHPTYSQFMGHCTFILKDLAMAHTWSSCSLFLSICTTWKW